MDRICRRAVDPILIGGITAAETNKRRDMNREIKLWREWRAAITRPDDLADLRPKSI